MHMLVSATPAESPHDPTLSRTTLSRSTQGKSRMRQFFTYGSARGAAGNGGSYRNRMTQRWTPATAWLVSRRPLDHCASRRGTCRGTPPTALENVVSPNDQRSTLAEHAVSDTHQGNLVQTGDGMLVPIDFTIQIVSGAMLDAVRSIVGPTLGA